MAEPGPVAGSVPVAEPGPVQGYPAQPTAQGHPLPAQGYPPPHQQWAPFPGPGGQPPMPPLKGSGPAVASLVFGLLGCVVPLLPINLDQVRAYTPFPVAVAGLALAIVGLVGRRRGKAMAVVGAILSVIALALGTIMVGNTVIDESTRTSAPATQHIPRGYQTAMWTGPNSPVRTCPAATAVVGDASSR
jgi:hypothetical protein